MLLPYWQQLIILSKPTHHPAGARAVAVLTRRWSYRPAGSAASYAAEYRKQKKPCRPSACRVFLPAGGKLRSWPVRVLPVDSSAEIFLRIFSHSSSHALSQVFATGRTRTRICNSTSLLQLPAGYRWFLPAVDMLSLIR